MKNYGKKTSFIDSNIFSDDLLTNKGNITDYLRFSSKNVWTKVNNSIVLGTKTTNEYDFSIDQIEDETILINANIKKFNQNIINDKGYFEIKFNKDLWEEYINLALSSIYEKNYEDYYFEVPEIKEVSNNSQGKEPGINFSKKNFVYNFFSPKYEELISDQTTNVVAFPSVFNIINDPNLQSRTYEENLILSLGGSIEANYVDSLFLARHPSDSLHSYFNKYVEKYQEPESATAIEFSSQFNIDIDINKDKINILRKLNFIPFPLYADLTFTSLINSENDLYHAIKNIGGTQQDLRKYLLDSGKDTSPKLLKNFVYEKNLENISLKHYDVKNWIESGANGKIGLVATNNPIDYNRSTNTLLAVEYRDVINYIKKYIKPQVRRYEEMFKNPCYTELLFYKIEKRQFNFDRANVLQTFYVDADKEDLIRIIDTQIKYGTTYYYTVKAYMLVVGNKYTYEKYDYSKDEILYKNDIENGKFRIKVKNSPIYKIFEVPYTKFSGAIYEKPYTKPQIKLGKQNDFLHISLLDSEQESKEVFEIITAEDFSIFENIKEAQESQDLIHSIRNNNSDSNLQIYKTIEKPTSYLSFQGKLYKTINIKNNFSFNDVLVPNLKYYYTFRYLNKHNIPSNLSDIFEVEMKEEDGYRYLVQSKFDVYQTAKKTNFKTMKRYLLLRPSMLQTQINTSDRFNNIKQINLGPDKQSVWNKNFILRITSKKTNRVLEFDLKSILKYDE